MRQRDIDLSIIIVSFNTKSYLEQCLCSVYANTSGISMEVLVVDNSSTDGSATMVAEKYPQVHLAVNSDNLGFACANNQAITLSKGRYVLLLNSDTVVLPEALRRLVEFMDDHPDAGVVGGKLLNPDKTFQASFANFPSLVTELLFVTKLTSPIFGPFFPSYPPSRSNDMREADWVGGACLMARRVAIEKVGLLDERFFMYSEEVDWCFRMRKGGWKVCYVPHAEVIHYGGVSSAKRSGMREILLRKSKLLFFRKHYGGVRSALLWLVYVIESGSKLLALTSLRFITRSKSVSRQVEVEKKVFFEGITSR